MPSSSEVSPVLVRAASCPPATFTHTNVAALQIVRDTALEPLQLAGRDMISRTHSVDA